MKPYINAFLYCLTAVVLVVLAGSVYQHRMRGYDVVNVTGSATQDFDSDIIVWESSFVQRNADLKLAYAALEADHKKVAEFLQAKTVSDKEFVFSSINIAKLTRPFHDEEGRYVGEVDAGYQLTQSVRVESSEVDKIEVTSREITKLINDGVELTSGQPEYYYSKLAELKISMVAEATKDGRQRAEQITQNSGAKLGPLYYSNLGIFQIMAPNSSEEVSWQGSFNRSSRKKRAMVTVKLQFGIGSASLLF